MQTYLEGIVEYKDPKGSIRAAQHDRLSEALLLTEDKILKIVCLLAETTRQIDECTVADQVLCVKFLQNVIDNIGQYTEPEVAAMFQRDLFDYDQH